MAMTKKEFLRYCETSAKGPNNGPLRVVIRTRNMHRSAVELQGNWHDRSILSITLFQPNSQWPHWEKANRRLEEARVKYQKWLDEYLVKEAT